MTQTEQKPPTVLSHGDLPYPKGTLVEDAETGQTGELQGVIEERVKGTGKLFSQTAYMRPRGGGFEWEAPLDRIRPTDDKNG
ncbi:MULTISPECIES: hypothetical protein [Streptomyces]|uniref:Uncharacterized protein n=2 Tax=Streptomyces TaxID=1883 RepID=A0ABX6WHI2_STRMQ|nr:MULTISPECIES: hypothetical protein [Streptomyces]AQA15486.1 hypothetical protein BV401_38860 [Streptomyces autolyticus]MCC4314564.1 hypothetical protein [Streptomyces malaysiensis]MCQ6247686.1 hypothetical protein [Streptomyces malaysiensis]NUH37195.1 hypothetical protein [Streptomyces samsunensis]QPI60095.1 hypothetical protein I1A49_38995 [Streptomyces solisilvae]